MIGSTRCLLILGYPQPWIGRGMQPCGLASVSTDSFCLTDAYSQEHSVEWNLWIIEHFRPFTLSRDFQYKAIVWLMILMMQASCVADEHRCSVLYSCTRFVMLNTPSLPYKAASSKALSWITLKLIQIASLLWSAGQVWHTAMPSMTK